MILSSTTDNLQVVLTGSVTTNQLACFSAYRDVSATNADTGKNAVNTNNTTDVNLVAAPGASTVRIVDYLSIFNRDTVSQEVTVKLDLNGTEYIMTKVTLAVNERLEFVRVEGFRVIGNNGAIKQTYSSGNNPVSSVQNITVLSSDQTNNNATANTIADVTGLSFAVTAGKTYRFRFVIDFTSAATTTGSRWSVNGPGSPTRLSYDSEYSLTTTSKTFNTGLTAYDLPAASNASAAATGGNFAVVEGFITPSANGTVIARFASEISSSAIVAKAGSYVEWQEVL